MFKSSVTARVGPVMHSFEFQGEKTGFNLGPVHIAPYSYENGYKSIRFCLAFTLLRYENGDF